MEVTNTNCPEDLKTSKPKKTSQKVAQKLEIVETNGSSLVTKEPVVQTLEKAKRPKMSRTHARRKT